ncbi:MAG: ArsA-related P-loop ATPase [Candidatus Geothermincolales bacterium]
MENSIIAVGVAGGSSARTLAEKVDSHPLMGLTGLASELNDLLRMVERTQPDALLLPLSLARELSALPLEDLNPLLCPICFIVCESAEADSEARVLLSLPLRIGGSIDPAWDADEMYRFISSRLRLFAAERRGRTVRAGSRGRTSIHLFVGGKGGCGTTLMAMSVSFLLARAEKRVLLMEPDPRNSQLGVFLGDKGGKSVPELLPLADDLSWDMLNRGLCRHTGGFFILPFQAATGGMAEGKAGEASSARWPHLLRNLSFIFDHVILDAPPGAFAAFPILPLLSSVFLVCTQDIMSVQGTRNTVQGLRKYGVSSEKLWLLLNRYSRRCLVEPHHIVQATGLEIAALIPDRPNEGRDFAELGKLPLEKSPIYKSLFPVVSRLLSSEVSTRASGTPDAKATVRGKILLDLPDIEEVKTRAGAGLIR